MMSLSVCSRGLLQQSLDRTVTTVVRSQLSRHGAAWFSTTHRVAARAPAMAKKKRNSKAPPPKKGSRFSHLKNKNRTEGKVVERETRLEATKAAKKRIILTNNNALEVRSLQDLDETNIMSQENEGKVMGLPEGVVDQLRAVEAFKRNQGWSLFRRPAVLIRKESNQLARLFEEVEQSISDGQEKKTIRRIISGEGMSGKSVLLLHGLIVGFLRNWFVVNIPDGYEITNATTEYSPLPQAQPLQYTQNNYTSKLLQQILDSNRPFLESTKLTTKPDLPLPLTEGGTLRDLIELGTSNTDVSWPVFVALWKEISLPGRPPVLLAIDGLPNIMRNSEYISANMKPIHAHDFTLVRHFVDRLSGQVKLPNGGIVLAATSYCNAPASPSLRFLIQIAEARQKTPDNIPEWNPYKVADERVMEVLKDLKSGDNGLDVLTIGGLSKEEARSIIEYYAESGMLRHQIHDGFVSEKWSLAGMGNFGELERASVRARV